MTELTFRGNATKTIPANSILMVTHPADLGHAGRAMLHDQARLFMQTVPELRGMIILREGTTIEAMTIAQAKALREELNRIIDREAPGGEQGA